MRADDSLESAWRRYDELKKRLLAYIVSSEEEFAGVIGALDSCWSLAENVQCASGLLTEMTSVGPGSETAAVRDLVLAGCRVFREFLDHIHDVSKSLAVGVGETKQLLRSSTRFQEDLLPLNYIAFALRLEGSRLSPNDGEAITKVYAEMQTLVGAMKRSGDSQQNTLVAVTSRLSTASTSVERAAVAFDARAGNTEQSLHKDLDLLSQVPSGLIESRRQAETTGTLIADGIRNAATALQGHDAIRQQTDHVLERLHEVRKGRGMEAGHALVLQRQQAKHIQQLIQTAGGRIEQELNTVIRAAKSIATGPGGSVEDTAESALFEKAVDRLTAISVDIAGLLEGELALGKVIIEQIDPVRALLDSNSEELESLAFALKMLALNVIIAAEQIPGTGEIDVLGSWTAAAADRVLLLVRPLNEQFKGLGINLHSLAGSTLTLLQQVEVSRQTLLAVGAADTLRNSRRNAYRQIAALGEEGAALQAKTDTLLRSLTFVETGRDLFEELVGTIETLLLLYPTPKEAMDYATAMAGYSMRDQHDVHASVFGGNAVTKIERLSEPAQGDDYGDNVELF